MKHVLIVGLGSIGQRHLRCFQTTQRVRTSICEPSDTLRQSVAEQYPCKGVYASLKQALQGPAIDAAVICTPAPLHVPMAMTLAQQGVHLLIEKPLSTSLQNVAELQQVVAQRKLTAGVAYVARQNPLMRALRDMLRQHRFGKPVQYTSVSGQHFPTYRPAYREIYYNDHQTGGGAIQDALTHNLNLGEWLVGPIDRLVCDCDHKVLQGVHVEDTVHVITRQGGDDQVMGCYALNQHQAPNEKHLTVVCQGGTLRALLHEQTLSWCDKPDAPWQTQQFEPLNRDTLFIRQAHDFLNALEQDCPFACDLGEGLQTLKVNLAALTSARQQTWQTIDR